MKNKPENKENILKTLNSAREEAKKLGAILDCSHKDFIDDSHLNCVWYGGCFGILKYKGFEVWFTVCGEVRFTYFADFEHEIELLDYVDKNNDGAWMNSEAREILKNDTVLQIADDEDRIYWSNNNWVEYRIYDEKGENLVNDLFCDTVLDDNVLDALTELHNYTEWIDEYIKKRGGLDPNKLKITRIVEEATKIYFDYDGRHFVLKECAWEAFDYDTVLYERTLNEHGFVKTKYLHRNSQKDFKISTFIKRQKGKPYVYKNIDKLYFIDELNNLHHYKKVNNEAVEMSLAEAILEAVSSEAGEQND